MHWLNKLERKFGKYSIRRLIVYILAAYGIGYVVYFAGALKILPMEVYEMLMMDPAAIFHGQVWRLFTWICTVPQSPSLFLIFMFMLYYWIGTTLENVWGCFRYNLFMFSGIIMMTIAPLLIYVITGFMFGFENAINMSASTYYLNLTSFLAYATVFPNEKILFMMLIPIKMKWLAIVDALFLGYQFVISMLVGLYYLGDGNMLYAASGFSSSVAILIFVLNFLIFFFATRNYQRISPKEIKRKQVYKKQVRAAKASIEPGNHKCVICNRTDLTNPELQFRYCSKCNGVFEYCNEHLFTHEHRK